MANARKLDRSRKSIGNIRKITRTMELITTARFRKAMDRATAAARFTERMTRLVADLAEAGLEVKHPLLEPRESTENAVLLVLTANRGLCGGYNSGVLRLAFPATRTCWRTSRTCDWRFRANAAFPRSASARSRWPSPISSSTISPSSWM